MGNRLIVVFTFIIAISTVVNVYISSQLKTIEDNSLKLQRAFIGSMDRNVYIDEKNQVITFTIGFKNYGPIPSKNVNGKITLFLNNSPYDSSFVSNQALFPGQRTLNKHSIGKKKNFWCYHQWRKRTSYKL